MNFDVKKFALNIEQHNIKNRKVEEHKGVVNVINHITNGDLVDEINFDSFSLKDTLYALEAMECIGLVDVDDEVFVVDPRNPFMIFRQVDDAIYKLATSGDKLYEIETDEEIFI